MERNDAEWLTAEANRLLTDKGTIAGCAHGYTNVYGKIWGNIRETPVKLLEIGIGSWGAPSLNLWRSFFKNKESQIHGMDIQNFLGLTDAERGIFTHVGDQSKTSAFDQFDAFGPFDIVIDDGSHVPLHQHITLASMWDKVKPAGWFVIEDLHTRWAINAPLTKDLALRWIAGDPAASVDGSGLTRDFVLHMLSETETVQLFHSESKLWPAENTKHALLIIKKRK